MFSKFFKSRFWVYFKESGLRNFTIVLLVIAAVIIPVGIYFLRVDFQPVQTAHVGVVSKRLVDRGGSTRHTSRYSFFVTFEFPDGLETEFNVMARKSFDPIQEGDTGVLSYKQIGDGTGLMGRRFVSFEKDP